MLEVSQKIKYSDKQTKETEVIVWDKIYIQNIEKRPSPDYKYKYILLAFDGRKFEFIHS